MPLKDVHDDSLVRKTIDQTKYVTLYDPPVGGVTPVDGEGKPMASVVHSTDVEAKLAQGFTEEPLYGSRTRRR